MKRITLGLLVVRLLWSLGRFRNRCSAAELSGAADVYTVDHLHAEGVSGRAIQAAFAGDIAENIAGR